MIKLAVLGILVLLAIIILTSQSASANWIGGFNCFGEPRCVSGWNHAINQAQTDWNSGESKEERSYIYTTNYDRVLETYWEDKEINDLFTRGGLQQLDLNKLIDRLNIKLVKLHGSIDWFKLDDGRIVRSHVNRVKIAGRVVEGEIMLYPIQQKDLYAYPWLDIFRQFKEDLKRAKNWIVLGYSFNDEYVKAMFLEVLKDPKFEHKLIIVHPHVKEIATKFDGKQGSIIYIKAKLGENETVPKILEAVRISNTYHHIVCCVI
jgi:hypothetical protein